MYGTYASYVGGARPARHATARRGSMTEASDIITRTRVASTPAAGFEMLVDNGPTLRSTCPIASSKFAVKRSESPER